MREIRHSTAFRRDYKREVAGKHRKHLEDVLRDVLGLLVVDNPLPASKRDHTLSGEWAGHRECHLRPDLLLIYTKPDATTLDLVRLGSHSELFG
ncbi:MAG: type II toxin-antitoxin system YafQ family toxin [Deltaproteobacteria bacterium]